MRPTDALSEAAISPQTLAVFRRFVEFEAKQAEHMANHPEWWAKDGGCGDGSEAAVTWSELCVLRPSPDELLKAASDVLGVASVRCLVHEDCLASAILGRACAPHETHRISEGGGER